MVYIFCTAEIKAGRGAASTQQKGGPLRGTQSTKGKKHTTPGIRWWSPTQLLVWRSLTYLWESGRDPELSSAYGRMWLSWVEGAVI